MGFISSIKDKITELETRRAEVLHTLCEDDTIWHHSVIIQLVNEARSLTKILKILKGEEKTWY